MHRARATHSFIGATNMSTSECGNITNEIHQQHSDRYRLLINLTVDGNRDFLIHECFPSSARAKAVAITSHPKVSISCLRYSASAHMSVWVSVEAAAVSAALEIAELSLADTPINFFSAGSARRGPVARPPTASRATRQRRSSPSSTYAQTPTTGSASVTKPHFL